jgi:hypothetical protein
VARHGVPIRGRGRHNEQPSDDAWAPASVLRDKPRDHTDFAIERGVQVLDVDEPRLDFHDQERALLGSPRQDVDRPAVPVVVECVLDDDLPAEAIKLADDRVDQPGVVRVEELCDVRDRPAGTDLDDDPEHASDTPHRGEPNELEPTGFDQ